VARWLLALVEVLAVSLAYAHDDVAGVIRASAMCEIAKHQTDYVGKTVTFVGEYRSLEGEAAVTHGSEIPGVVLAAGLSSAQYALLMYPHWSDNWADLSIMGRVRRQAEISSVTRDPPWDHPIQGNFPGAFSEPIARVSSREGPLARSFDPVTK